MPKQKAFFIVFEGVEGSGKSYQSERLFNYLKKKKFKAIKTREPGGTKSSELIRNLILKDYFTKNQKEKFDKYTDTLLYLAARNEHVINKIIPPTFVVINAFFRKLFEKSKNLFNKIPEIIKGIARPNE